MATVLWIAYIALIFFSDVFYEIMSPGLYSVISVIVLICAIVATVQGKKKKGSKRQLKKKNVQQRMYLRRALLQQGFVLPFLNRLRLRNWSSAATVIWKRE